jgi:hypothetical protein
VHYAALSDCFCLIFAQRALSAVAIRLRAAAERTRLGVVNILRDLLSLRPTKPSILLIA